MPTLLPEPQRDTRSARAQRTPPRASERDVAARGGFDCDGAAPGEFEFP